MKLYVLYEQTCDGESNHRYFVDKDKAAYAKIMDEIWLRKHNLESYWKICEVETED